MIPLAEREEELKSFLRRVKEESEKAGLNSAFKKAKIMASSPITSWHLEGGKVEAVTDFIFLGSLWTVTAAMKLKEWKKQAAPWKKSYDKPAAAAKSRQLCPTLCDPIDGSPPGSAIPGILQARTLEWVAISSPMHESEKLKVKLLSRVELFETPWTVAHQAPPSMGFSRQEYWNGVPLPSPWQT